ncbi:MAG: hypothetical protein Q9202_005019, partial [Teloschistes flavicans]
MEILDSPPRIDQYISLQDHQSHTPASFDSGPPVLHHHCQTAILSTTSKDVASCHALTAFFPNASAQTNGSAHPPADNDTEDGSHDLSAEDIDIRVTSEKLILYSGTLMTGISIPYPSISLHAIQRSPTPSLLLHLLATPPPHFDDHDPENTISLTLTPTTRPSPPTTTAGAQAENRSQPPPPHPLSPPSSATAANNNNNSQSPEAEIQHLFTALSACADLHPDAADDAGSDIEIDGDPHAALPTQPASAYEQVDGLPPPMPGSGGWITAENVGRL